MENRRGVCRDFAHLAIGCLRSLGLAASLCQRLSGNQPPQTTSFDATWTPRTPGWRCICRDCGWAEFDYQ
ncbi:MAG: transglutaminase family protein [Candidatus Competibacteraceae bacterium]